MVTATWFRVSRWGFSIEKHEVRSTTDKTVTMANGRREGRFTDGHAWYPTEAEAIARCESELKREIDSTEYQLRRLREKLKKLQKGS